MNQDLVEVTTLIFHVKHLSVLMNVSKLVYTSPGTRTYVRYMRVGEHEVGSEGFFNIMSAARASISSGSDVLQKQYLITLCKITACNNIILNHRCFHSDTDRQGYTHFLSSGCFNSLGKPHLKLKVL